MHGPLRPWFLLVDLLAIAAGIWLIILGLWETGPLQGAAELGPITATGAVVAGVGVFILGVWVGWAMIGRPEAAREEAAAAPDSRPAPERSDALHGGQ